MLEAQRDLGDEQADMLLASMREWRKAGLKMILTGSIGLLGLARKHRFSVEHVNDLSSFQIPPLRDEDARAFIVAAVAGHPGSTWTDAHTQALLLEAPSLASALSEESQARFTAVHKASGSCSATTAKARAAGRRWPACVMPSCPR